MMLLFVILITWIPSMNSIKNANIQISEIRHQLGNIDQQTKEQFFKWKLSNGNLSSMDLIGKVLIGKPDANLLEEYIQMDISSGIEELNELSKEWKRAIALNVSEEERRKVLDVFDRVDTSQDKNKWMVEKLPGWLKEDMDPIEKRAKKIDELFTDFFYLTDYPAWKEIMRNYLFKHDPLFEMKNDSKVVEMAENATKIFGELKPIFALLEEGMKNIEELRDGNLIDRVKQLAHKLEDTVGNMSHVGIREDEMKEYDNNESASEFLQNTSKFTRFVNRVVRQFHLMKKRWIPIMDYFDQLQIPPGSLSEAFATLQRCAQLPIELSQELDNFTFQLQPVEEAKVSESRIREFWSFLKSIRFDELYFDFKEVIKNYENNKDVKGAILDNHIFKQDPEVRRKIFFGFNQSADWFIETQTILSKTDFEKVNQAITDTLSKAKEVLECYSQFAIPNTKSLVNLPLEVWNFDPRPTRHLMESVHGFKRVHKMMVELNDWKFEKKLENFELNEEEVNAISEGIEVIEQLKNIDGLVNEMNELSGLNGTEVEEAWIKVKDALGSLNEELSEHLPILESNLSHLQSAISTVQLPSDLPIQLIVDWVNANLKGVVHSEYSKTLQRLMALDFANYSSKLDKLSNSIAKWYQNNQPANPQKEEKNEEDCLVNYSDKCRIPL
uniref:WSN domain-containing protein n=3 Tax=Caenorhabditis tropicalis TaxID=1561998 RepID=A0A1I7ULK4_9PELO